MALPMMGEAPDKGTRASAVSRAIAVSLLAGALTIALILVADSSPGKGNVLVSASGGGEAALQSEDKMIDVGDSLDSSIVQKLSAALVPHDAGKGAGAGVKEAAEDIAKVLRDGKADDASVKNVLHRSKTHHGETSGAEALRKDLRGLGFDTSSEKKGKEDKLASTISSALGVSKAQNGQMKMAKEQALTIAKILEQSRADIDSADVIEKHAKTHKSSDNWDEYWSTKGSLVSRLAKEVGSGTGKQQVAAGSGAAAATSHTERDASTLAGVDTTGEAKPSSKPGGKPTAAASASAAKTAAPASVLAPASSAASASASASASSASSASSDAKAAAASASGAALPKLPATISKIWGLIHDHHQEGLHASTSDIVAAETHTAPTVAAASAASAGGSKGRLKSSAAHKA